MAAVAPRAPKGIDNPARITTTIALPGTYFPRWLQISPQRRPQGDRRGTDIQDTLIEPPATREPGQVEQTREDQPDRLDPNGQIVSPQVLPGAEHMPADRPDHQDRHRGLDGGDQPVLPA